MTRDEKLQRANQMIGLYKSGMSLEQVGEAFDLSRERVRQILRGMGVGRDVSGASVRISQQRSRELSIKNDRAMCRYGMPHDQYLALRNSQAHGGYKNTPKRAFTQQRQNARDRGIAFNLTFAEWWRIWDESGKWAKRGRTSDRYVMCRRGDEGAYEVGNVYIETTQHNIVTARALGRKRKAVSKDSK